MYPHVGHFFALANKRNKCEPEKTSGALTNRIIQSHSLVHIVRSETTCTHIHKLSLTIVGARTDMLHLRICTYSQAQTSQRIALSRCSYDDPITHTGEARTADWDGAHFNVKCSNRPPPPPREIDKCTQQRCRHAKYTIRLQCRTAEQLRALAARHRQSGCVDCECVCVKCSIVCGTQLCVCFSTLCARTGDETFVSQK